MRYLLLVVTCVVSFASSSALAQSTVTEALDGLQNVHDTIKGVVDAVNGTPTADENGCYEHTHEHWHKTGSDHPGRALGHEIGKGNQRKGKKHKHKDGDESYKHTNTHTHCNGKAKDNHNHEGDHDNDHNYDNDHSDDNDHNHHHD